MTPPLYPGVDVEEHQSGIQPIAGVPTSVTAFIGSTLRGVVDAPVAVQSFETFERIFGGLSQSSPLSYAVKQFFDNRGTHAVIIRVVNEATRATGAAGMLALEAANPGAWGSKLRVRLEHKKPRPRSEKQRLFHLTVVDSGTGLVERFEDLSLRPDHVRFVTKVLTKDSQLVRVRDTLPMVLPPETTFDGGPARAIADPFGRLLASSHAFNSDGADGGVIGDAHVISDASLAADKRGLWALDDVPLFNLLCIPPYGFAHVGEANDADDVGGASSAGGRDHAGNGSGAIDVGPAARTAAAAYCEKRRAIFLADPPTGWTTSSAASDAMRGASSAWTLGPNTALYFPRLRIPDPLRAGAVADCAPCGAVAGVIARTDAERGVWKAPSGSDATLRGVTDLTIALTDRQNTLLTALGVNCLRTFPATGAVVWGARTLGGADALAPEWKYLPVRRLALFIEESVVRGTEWAVFEPNDESLWARLRLGVGDFLQGLFRQGAFQGRSPREAYFVKCDHETTTQHDVDVGIVNIVVGFAPLKPAEFVIINVRQTAAQVA